MSTDICLTGHRLERERMERLPGFSCILDLGALVRHHQPSPFLSADSVLSQRVKGIRISSTSHVAFPGVLPIRANHWPEKTVIILLMHFFMSFLHHP